ncbi:MAG: hypothetical protein VX520_00540, partial [Planctomycetota bacterium]|nr:hypothetical protein [Planctomycetota bacterium]
AKNVISKASESLGEKTQTSKNGPASSSRWPVSHGTPPNLQPWGYASNVGGFGSFGSGFHRAAFALPYFP